MFNKTQMTTLEMLSVVGSIPVQGSLALRAQLHPDKRLYTFLNDSGEESDWMTYLELWRQARTIADRLCEESQPGDRVMLFFPQGLSFIGAFLGCLMSGRVAVPINLPTRHRVDKCVNVIVDSGAKLALAPYHLIDGLVESFENTQAADLNWIATDQLPLVQRAPVRADVQADIDANGMAFLQYTSGSTSNPRGVMVTHRNITINLRLMRDMWELDEHSDMVFWQPHHHDMGLIMGQLLPIMLGNHSVLMGPNTAVRQPTLWLQAISRYRAKMAGGPNFIYDLAVDRYSPEKLKDVDLSCWKVAPNGADVVRAATLERFCATYEKYGFNAQTFLPCYGLAEATLVVSGGPIRPLPSQTLVDVERLERDRFVETPTQADRSRMLVGCGEPSWEFDVAIVEPETLRKCQPHEVGEIWLHGPSVAAGYWKNPASTEQTFHAHLADAPDKKYLRTGDLGFIGRDDKQLYICGRLKDLVICDGRNLHPEDIEASIIESSDLLKPQTCAVFSHDAENQRQHIVAVIEVSRDLKRNLGDKAKELKAAIRQAVAADHGVTLNKIVFIPPANLKKTTSGKVQRGLMKQLYLNDELDVITA